MPPMQIRGILKYIGNESRIKPCACEPVQVPSVNVLLARNGGIPDDISGATSYLKNLGWTSGTCVSVSGTPGTIGGVDVLYLQQIQTCPNGPCNRF
jgi:hypothetical protein